MEEKQRCDAGKGTGQAPSPSAISRLRKVAWAGLAVVVVGAGLFASSIGEEVVAPWHQPLTRRLAALAREALGAVGTADTRHPLPPIPQPTRAIEGNNRRRGLAGAPTEYDLKGSYDKSHRKTATIAYTIIAGVDDSNRIKRMLSVIYSPDNFYLIHLDKKTPTMVREAMRKYLTQHPFVKGTIKLLEPAVNVRWGSFSLLMTNVFGVAAALEMGEWDYYMNLSASDFPLLSQDEMAEVLGSVMDSRLNFLTGGVIEFEREFNRITGYNDDEAVFMNDPPHNQIDLIKVHNGNNKHIFRRDVPNLFQIYKGEFWVLLHRSLAEYSIRSPDGVARQLFAYFASMRICDESYFQTVVCHPNAPAEFPVLGNCLRYVNWPPRIPGQPRPHPSPIESNQVDDILATGMLFARKFDYSTADGRAAVDKVEKNIKDKSQRKKRIARTLEHILPAIEATDKFSYCNASGEYTSVGAQGIGTWP